MSIVCSQLPQHIWDGGTRCPVTGAEFGAIFFVNFWNSKHVAFGVFFLVNFWNLKHVAFGVFLNFEFLEFEACGMCFFP